MVPMDMHTLVFHLNGNKLLPIILYIGPETILPLTSALAAIVGVLLMFWHRFVGMIRKIWRIVFKKGV
jgi:hypothetical protein